MGTIEGRPITVFCSNDYLGLGGSPLVRAAKDGLAQDGVGAAASRLISGTHPVHLRAEDSLASWVGAPAALLFSTGYAANVGALSALLGRDDVAFSDRLNHASLIDGLRLSRARVHVYEHSRPAHLRELLRRHRAEGRRALIVSDSLFSMDGDLADPVALRSLADEYDAGLYVDEAHALGVMGEGRGWCHHHGVRPDVLMGTLGKAFGVAGAFVAGSAALRSWLENRARSYVFSTAPPPALCHAIITSVRRVQEGQELRERVLRHAEVLRSRLRGAGWRVPEGRSMIVPILIGDPERTMRLSASLLERGFFVQGIRPPTVPEGTSRLRLVPTAAHTDAQIEGLLRAFDELEVP